MSDQRNDSVTFSGGTFHGPVAAGANARATQYRAGAPAGEGDELRAQLAEVRRLIEENAADLANVEKTLRDVRDVEDEVAGDNPDTDRIDDALSRLRKRVVTVTAVAAGVVKLEELVRNAFS